LGENEVHTHPEHPDERMRGRTYAIPFARVWEAVVQLAGGGLRGWTTVTADEDLGILTAECSGLLPRLVDDVEIRMSLDENALTRIDMSSRARKGRGDLGRNARRVRKFFRALDRRIEAGPGKILDPTLSIIGAGLFLAAFLVGCGPSEEPPLEAQGPEPDSLETSRNFQGRSYERHIVFLTFQGDSTLIVPWFFSARTRPNGVDREVRGWLARSDTWDAFLSDQWEAPPNSAPWRILPHGPVRLVVGEEDAVEAVIFQEGGRNLEVRPGELLVEWSGQRAQTFRVQEGTIVLSDQTVQGHVLDMSRAWEASDPPPGDWGILLSGDSLQVVLEDLEGGLGGEGGSYSLRARVNFLTREWRDVRLNWSEIRAYEPARRDIPTSWNLETEGGDLSGNLTAVAPHFEVGEGEGPMLPVQALFEVVGTLTFGGGDYPVRGLIRHSQG
jgi:hypothetical protein